jgi:uncharacterized membrane protein
LDALGSLILFVVVVVIGLPTLIAGILFARTRRLRRDLDDLRARLTHLETGAIPATAPAVDQSQTISIPEYDAPLPPPLPAATLETSGEESTPPPRLHDRPRGESLESRIGGRWLLNIGVAAIVIGVAYFEKLAIEKRWIGETARVIQGGVLGAALIAAGSWFSRRAMAGYGQMLTGGGVAILYVSTYAAFNYYHLIERPTAFALMIAITALGAWLADRRGSQGLAVLAIGGAFLTPFLLPGTSDAQTALFTYVAIVVAGTVFLAHRRDWPLLDVVSYVFTLLTVAAWADRFYTPEKYLRTEIYITVYAAMFVAIAWSSRRMADAFAEFASWFVWTAPIAYYAASLTILGPHPMALLVWVIAIALVGGVLTGAAGTAAGFVVWIAAAVPLLAWTQTHATPQWLTPGLSAVAALYGIALAAQVRIAAEGTPPGRAEIAWIHLNALLMFAGACFLLETSHLAWTGPAGAAFAGWHAGGAGLLWKRDRERAIHFAALAFTLLAIATALQFDGPIATVGWAAEGAAIVTLGLLQRRAWLRLGGVLLFAFAVARTFDLLLSHRAVATDNPVLNPTALCAVLAVVLCYGLAWLHYRDPDAPARDAALGTSLVAAQLLTLALLTREIHAAAREGAFAGELTVSLTWAIYATALIVIGLQRQYALIRYFAIAWFGITIAKVFFSDLAELERIYRVMSVIGLGITLLLTSYLYQRMRGTVR